MKIEGIRAARREIQERAANYAGESCEAADAWRALANATPRSTPSRLGLRRRGGGCPVQRGSRPDRGHPQGRSLLDRPAADHRHPTLPPEGRRHPGGSELDASNPVPREAGGQGFTARAKKERRTTMGKIGPRGGGTNGYTLAVLVPESWKPEIDRAAREDQRTRADFLRALIREAIKK